MAWSSFALTYFAYFAYFASKPHRGPPTSDQHANYPSLPQGGFLRCLRHFILQHCGPGLGILS
jgi:hypothetical protein